MVRIRINGEDLRKGDEITFSSRECSDAAGWGVILLGILACIGWWLLWT